MSAASEREALVWDLSTFLFPIYDHGTSPNARGEAEAIIGFLESKGLTRQSRAEIQAEDGLDKIADDAATNDGRVIVWAVNELTRAVRGVEAAIREGGDRG